MTIGVRLGFAVAAGVPVLVLVSMGPVAALVGTPSVLVWSVSACLGFLMSLAFAGLASSFPNSTGGIGALAAQVLGQRSRKLALLAQWSYWFGWSPALAINGILFGTYVRDTLLPATPGWTAVLLASALLVASATINHFGLRPGALLQAGLAVCVFGAMGLLLAGALGYGRFTPSHLAPFEPPGGWMSSRGLVAIGGALFIAGWSAYGSELALSYATEYRRRAPDAVRALVLVGLASIVAYCAIPLTLVAVLGIARVQDDPAVGLAPLAQQTAGGGPGWIVGVLVVALVLVLNMVTVASSRLLYQMGRNGDAWRRLGRLNRHGVPGNALRFDLVANVLLLVVAMALNRGRTTDLPIALLAASNVGYFVSISLALAAAWLNRRGVPADRRAHRVGGWPARLGPGLAGFNVLLLVCAGFAWGWDHVALGVLVLLSVTGAMGALATRARPAAVSRRSA